MSAPRGLSADEATAWETLVATVTPIHPSKAKGPQANGPALASSEHTPERQRAVPSVATRPTSSKPNPPGNLDGQWDRKLKSGAISPDITLDLHGHNLDAAYDRLMGGMSQARAIGARTILLVTGKPRPVDPADRGVKRGAIRAKVLDWLAASSHRAAIAAVRRAHIRHGGDGALYIILKRTR